MAKATLMVQCRHNIRQEQISKKHWMSIDYTIP